MIDEQFKRFLPTMVEAFLPNGYSYNPHQFKQNKPIKKFFKGPGPNFKIDLNLFGFEQLDAEKIEFINSQFQALVVSFYVALLLEQYDRIPRPINLETFGNFKFTSLRDNVVESFLSPISIVSNCTRYIVLDNGNTTKFGRTGDVAKTVLEILIWNVYIDEIYKDKDDDSIFDTGIEKLQDFLLNKWPEAVPAVRSTVSKFQMTSLQLPLNDVLKKALVSGPVKDLGTSGLIDFILKITGINVDLAELKPETILAGQKPGKLLIKAGGLYGELAGNYTRLVELQKEVESLKLLTNRTNSTDFNITSTNRRVPIFGGILFLPDGSIPPKNYDYNPLQDKINDSFQTTIFAKKNQ